MRSNGEAPIFGDVSAWARSLLIVGISLTAFGQLGAALLLVWISLYDVDTWLLVLPIVLIVLSALSLLVMAPVLWKLLKR